MEELHSRRSAPAGTHPLKQPQDRQPLSQPLGHALLARRALGWGSAPRIVGRDAQRGAPQRSTAALRRAAAQRGQRGGHLAAGDGRARVRDRAARKRLEPAVVRAALPVPRVQLPEVLL